LTQAEFGRVQAAFARALAVRGKGPEAQALADQYFFENLVRIHRVGEGAPYTGILPAGTPIEPAIALADQVLESGNADKLVKAITHHVGGRDPRTVRARGRHEETDS
jgi:hypothetical protein